MKMDFLLHIFAVERQIAFRGNVLSDALKHKEFCNA